MAVPADDVEAIFAEDGIDTILVYATEDVPVYRDGEQTGTYPAGSRLYAEQYDAETEQFVGTSEGERYDIAPFEHASVAQYEEADLPVPTLIQELEGEDTPAENDGAAPAITVESASEQIVPGGLVTVTGTGFTPNTEVVLTLDEQELDVVTADDEDAINASVQLPNTLVTATYDLVASGSEEDEEANFELAADPVLAGIATVSEAEVGETVRLTVENADEFEAAYGTGDGDFAIDLQGEFQDAENRATRFGNEGISLVEEADDAYTFEFTIPETVTSVSETYDVEPGANFNFYVAITFGSDLEDVEYIPSGTQIEIVGDETPGNPGGEENSEDEGDTQEGDQTPEAPEPVEPALTVNQDEILLEGFVGDAEEGTGVLHRVEGAAPGTTVEYTVETPDAIAPFDSSDEADEEGILEFRIHGYDVEDPSVYLGEYTTTATFEDFEGEDQDLSVSFTVVDGTEQDEAVDSNEQEEDNATDDEDIVPVVDTDNEATAAEEEDDEPAVGSADPQLADTGACGAQLAWIAGGLLVVGGAFVLYANRARLFGRKN